MARRAAPRLCAARQSEFDGKAVAGFERRGGADGQVDLAVEATRQPVEEAAAGGGLAGADLAGQQADTAQVDEMGEPRLAFGHATGVEHLVGCDVGFEGGSR